MARSQSRAESAIQRITSLHSSSRGHLHFLPLDLSDLTTIKPAVERFLARESRLDWLNHNAAISMPDPKTKSPQGHDLSYATNVLGPYLLTKLLLPTLNETARKLPDEGKGMVRVSWAGSAVIEALSQSGGLAFDSTGTPKDYWWNIYTGTKTANLFLCREFARRTDAVLHNCYNPGNLKSNLLHNLRAQVGEWMLRPLDWFVLYPGVMGAYTELWAGLSPELGMGDQGCYIVPWGRKVGEGHLRNDLVQNIGEGRGSEKLWDWCERETGRFT
ncbi:short-chain alcohol dehydrogenase [Neophaeococcomyces mojaviensis]|uniref:Short-chain alcohol dehydrogenase n=1 Tax=Neophaeococcomyces mojaviensis TaxID=3383035 RepID=A0ACC3A6D9_9EURO|nr:short-chain alcohol dehydrogenase [Knufia sp. JES_112]